LVQDGQRIFPALWGKHSYSLGSEMSRTEILAGFIRANMPLGKPNSLSEQDAWDLAAYINGQQRPAAPSRP
jgi:thiosulfate dehydrogenase